MGSGITRAISVAVIVVIIVAAVVGTAVYLSMIRTSTTNSSSSTTSSSSTSGGTSTSSSSSSSSGTLSIDDFIFEGYGASNSILYGSSAWPQWSEGSVYQTLVSLNLTAEQKSNQLQYLPDLATNWTISSDYATYTFTIRPGVTYSNGDPFNAYDVWTEFYMIYDLYGNSSTFWAGLSIFDFSGVNFGSTTLTNINASGLANPSSSLVSMMSNPTWPVYAPNADTIVYHLDSPFLFFMGTLVGWNGLIFDPIYVLHNGGPESASGINPYFNTHAIPGTGPYYASQIVSLDREVFQQNPNYWGRNLTAMQIAGNPMLDPGHYSSIHVYYKADDTSRYIDLTTGATQISAVEVSNFQLIQRNPNYGYMNLNYPAGIERMAMNTQVFPTNITDVRLAIVHAINYTDVISKSVFGFGDQVVGPETPNFGAYYNPANLPQYSYNLTLARQYLAKAGFPNGTNLPTITMAIDSASLSYEQPMAAVLQSDLSQIGIQVSIQIVLTSQYYQYFGPYSYELQNAQHIPMLTFDGAIPYSPDYMTPTDYWSYFITNMSLYGNYAVYDNPVVDQNVAFMFHSINETAVLQHLAVAQTQMYNDAPYAWLYVAKLPLASGTYAYNKHVIGGFYGDPNLEGVCTLPMLNTIYPAAG